MTPSPGHLNIIRRTSRIFDRVIVCVMYNSNKTSPMFSVEERIDMVQRAVYKYPNVTVDSSAGLLAEYAKQFPGAVVVKGLRAASDFEYEFQMNLINKKINPEMETARYDADLKGLVPDEIIEDIREKAKQWRSS